MAQTDRTTGLVGEAAFKVPCRAATTVTIVLSGEQTVDGVALVTGDRCLVKNQASSVDNGIYVVDTGTWTRALDCDGTYDLVKGSCVHITDGNTYQRTWFELTTNDPEIGTSALVFVLALIGDASTVGFTPAGAGAVATTIQAALRRIVYLHYFGAVGDGVADDSVAWDAFITYINTQVSAAITTGYAISTAKGRIAAGDYKIVTGKSVANLNVDIEGDGRENTRIRITAGQYLLTSTATVLQFSLRGVSTSGGKGVLKHSSLANNVQGQVTIEKNNFHDYTEVAIGSLSVDFPYWRVLDNVFRGAAALTSKGLVLMGLNDNARIVGNSFLANLYNIKLGHGGNNVYIAHNDFVKFNASGASPQVDVWVVPQAAIANSGSGLMAFGNKFGNENLSAGDLRFLLADEGAGTDAFDKNHSTAASTGFWTGFSISHNLFNGSAGSTKGLIYSYTPNVEFGRFEKNSGAGTKHPYILEFDAGVAFAADDRLKQSNIFEEPLFSSEHFETAPMAPTNANPGAALTRDEYGVLHGTAAFRHHFGAGFDPGFKPVGLTSTASPGLSSATAAALTDPVGGGEASTITYSAAAGFAFYTLTIADLVVGRAAWIEFDIRRATVNPILSFTATLQTDVSVIAAKRVLSVPDHWITVRMPWIPVQNGTTLRLRLTGTGYVVGVTEQLDVARIRVYHAHEPVNQGNFQQGKTSTLLPAVLKASVVTTNVGNVGGGEDDLMTYAMPANAMFEAKKGVRITAWGSTANNSNPKTVKLYFGSLAIITTALTISQAGVWRIIAEVISTGTDAQDYASQLIQGGATTLVDAEEGTHTQDDGAAITIKCTGTVTDGGGGINNNDILQKGMLVEMLN